MFSVIKTRLALSDLFKSCPEIIEVRVQNNFDFSDYKPQFYLRCKEQPDITKICNCICNFYKDNPRLYVGYHKEDWLFHDTRQVWYDGKYTDI